MTCVKLQGLLLSSSMWCACMYVCVCQSLFSTISKQHRLANEQIQIYDSPQTRFDLGTFFVMLSDVDGKSAVELALQHFSLSQEIAATGWTLLRNLRLVSHKIMLFWSLCDHDAFSFLSPHRTDLKLSVLIMQGWFNFGQMI